jgi:hypothetical protein
VKRQVHIVEGKVYDALDGAEKGAQPLGAGHWCLESHVGVSGGVCKHRWQHCGYGEVCRWSVVDIEGIGTILYECKTSEHRSLMSVYYIP